MTYPVGWDLVNITGTYVGRNGVPCVGSVTLSSPQLVLRSGTIVPAADIVFTLDANGSFTGQIPATDDPNANPSGWVYTVTENVPGGRQGYLISAPHTSPGIDLSTVIPIGMPMPPTFGFPYVTLAQLAGTVVGDGAYLIGYQNPAPGSTASTVQATLVQLQNKSNLEFSALDYPGVDPTGATDSAAGLQLWINACVAAGVTGYLPTTTAYYQCAAQLTANGAFRMRGDGVTPYIGTIPTVGTATRGPGSWIYFNHLGAGLYLAGAANGFAGCDIRDVGFIRVQPTPNGGAYTPSASAYDIVVDNCDALIEDVCLLNASYGIQHINGGYGRLRCNRITGQPLIRGIDIEESYDAGFINNIHFWPYWSNDTGVRAYMLQNATAIQLYRWDDGVCDGNFSIGYKFMYWLGQNTAGAPNKLTITNSFGDEGGYFVFIDSSCTTANTVNLTNSRAVAQTSGPLTGSSNVQISGNNQILNIDNCDFSMPQAECVRIQGSGNVVNIGNVVIGGWNQANLTYGGIDAATSGNIITLASPPTISSSPLGATSPLLEASGSTVRCPLGQGTTTATTNASGFITVTLPSNVSTITPRSAVSTASGITPYFVQPDGYAAGSVTVQVRNTSGAAVTSTSVTFSWRAAF